jgi:hypothetical protein
MHAMDDKIEPSDADKARLVWEAARVPSCGPIDDKAAETLGKALERAAQWRTNAGSTLPSRERERLKKIEGHANKLAQLLGEQSGTRDNIERYWPDSADPIDWPDLTCIIRELQTLSMAAREAQMHRGGAAVLRDTFGSAERLFIAQAGKVYRELAHRKPAYTRRADQTLEGPFVRFVQEASRQFCKGATIPAGETIKKAIDAEKKRLRNIG